MTDFSLRKRPAQARSQATFDAVVQACGALLPQLGYNGITTNHIAQAAGVAISSLYEYFPHKDSIVALVAEALTQRVMQALTAAVPQVLSQDPQQAMQQWIGIIYRVLEQERGLLRVFYYEVPYTNQLPSVRGIMSQLMAFSESMQSQAGSTITLKYHRASLYLIVNLVSNTIIQLILDPPPDIERDDILQALAYRIHCWVSGH